MHKLLGTDQFLWCWTTRGSRSFKEFCLLLLEWELDVPLSEILAFHSVPIWDEIVGGKSEAWDRLSIEKATAVAEENLAAWVRFPLRDCSIRCLGRPQDNRVHEWLSMNVQLVQGDLLDQDVDVIVNAWNRNIIPWWLLLPQGISGAIKRRGGTGPFKELRKYGSIPLGGAVLTSAGRLPFKGIIHVAGINMLWRASEWSVRQSVRNAMALANEKGFQSIAFPLIGAGSGGFNQDRAKAIMEDELGKLEYPMEVRIVMFVKA